MFSVRISLFQKLVLMNVALIFLLTTTFIFLNYSSTKTLLSRAMNGVDREAMVELSGFLSEVYADKNASDPTPSWGEWSQWVNMAFFKVFFKHYKPSDFAQGETSSQDPCDPPFGTFLQRLSLLDAKKKYLIKAEILKKDVYLRPINVDGETVAWLEVGKINMDVLPLADYFFKEQVILTAISALVGAILATLLSIFLARHFTYPIDMLISMSKKIARREFGSTVSIKSGDEFEELARSFNYVASKLRQFEQQQKQWLMDISHELRTPLTVLVGEVAAVKDNVTPLNLNVVDSIHEEVVQIKRLVDDLHELSMMDREGFNMQLKPMSISKVLRFQYERFRPLLLEREIELSLSMEQNEDIFIKGDADRIAQVLRNLLDNCYRYTQRAGWVKIKIYTHKNKVIVQVEDSGPGVADEDLARIFDRLYRADASRTRNSGGSGLGLSICGRILNYHGGDIVATKAPAGGLLMQISIEKFQEGSSEND